MKPGERRARAEIARLVKDFYRRFHAAPSFRPGRDKVPYGGRVYDGRELAALADSALDFWLTAGPRCAAFEKALAGRAGVKFASLVNSGSSANLLALAALAAPELGARRLKPGDEVITAAAGFPTTVAPALQYGAVPVFVDVELPSCNVSAAAVRRAVTRRTRVVMLAHTLGNPYAAADLRAFCDRRGLWLVEDNCDALGSRLGGRPTGSFGHLSTCSFYPPHHITTGEGGAVLTDDPLLNKLVESFRDWGRDCRCPAGTDNSCGRRFSGRYGELPAGYDHKYVYSRFGYNLKATEQQAAVGLEQLRKLDRFTAARRRNWLFLRRALAPYEKLLQLPEPAPGSEPSWFGFLALVRPGAGFSRGELVAALEAAGVQTRMLFAGNLLRQPCFDELRRAGRGYRVVGGLRNTDAAMERAFWVGVYPGLDGPRLRHIAAAFRGFLAGRQRGGV